MTVTLYTKPNCPQCTATQKKLDDLGIAYETVDVTQDAKALEYVTGLGHKSAPVLVTDTDNWSGYRPDRIEEIS